MFLFFVLLVWLASSPTTYPASPLRPGRKRGGIASRYWRWAWRPTGFYRMCRSGLQPTRSARQEG